MVPRAPSALNVFAGLLATPSSGRKHPPPEMP